MKNQAQTQKFWSFSITFGVLFGSGGPELCISNGFRYISVKIETFFAVVFVLSNITFKWASGPFVLLRAALP